MIKFRLTEKVICEINFLVTSSLAKLLLSRNFYQKVDFRIFYTVPSQLGIQKYFVKVWKSTVVKCDQITISTEQTFFVKKNVLSKEIVSK